MLAALPFLMDATAFYEDFLVEQRQELVLEQLAGEVGEHHVAPVRRVVRVADLAVERLGTEELRERIEQGYGPGWTLLEPKEPFERTQNLFRFKVEVPAGKQVEKPQYGGTFVRVVTASPNDWDEITGSPPVWSIVPVTDPIVIGDWTKGPQGSAELGFNYFVSPSPNSMVGCVALAIYLPIISLMGA
jgi:hypothetical protein